MRWLLVITVLCAAPASPEDLRAAGKSARTCETINGLELGRSTFQDLIRLLGPAKQYGNKRELLLACYTDPTGATLVWIDVRHGAAYRFLDTFSPEALSKELGPVARAEVRCTRVETALRTWTAAGGLRLGMSRDEVQGILGPPANSDDRRYMYYWNGKVMTVDGHEQGLELHFGPHGIEAILAWKFTRT